MTTLRNILFGLVLTTLSCRENNNKIDNTIDNKKVIDEVKVLQKSDTSNQYIYDFMKVVIANKNLDSTYGLTIEPEINCDVSQDDETFLKTLLIEKNKKENENDITVITSEIDKCLTKADIQFMLNQKAKLKLFKWDNSKLGFNFKNEKNWYSFSLPLFSTDQQKAIIKICSLCPGLCGTGQTVLFTKENNNWTSQMNPPWVH
jgi:hypothetical protein